MKFNNLKAHAVTALATAGTFGVSLITRAGMYDDVAASAPAVITDARPLALTITFAGIGLAGVVLLARLAWKKLKGGVQGR